MAEISIHVLDQGPLGRDAVGCRGHPAAFPGVWGETALLVSGVRSRVSPYFGIIFSSLGPQALSRNVCYILKDIVFKS